MDSEPLYDDLCFVEPMSCFGEKMMDCAVGLTCTLIKGEPHCEGIIMVSIENCTTSEFDKILIWPTTMRICFSSTDKLRLISEGIHS